MFLWLVWLLTSLVINYYSGTQFEQIERIRKICTAQLPTNFLKLVSWQDLDHKSISFNDFFSSLRGCSL